MPAREQPALVAYLEDGLPPGRPADVQAPTTLVLFLDGTWRSCRIIGWVVQGDGNAKRYWCLLRWGVWGRLWEGWYLYDPERIRPFGHEKGGPPAQG